MKSSFTATVLYDNKKETFKVKSDPVKFEKKIKPYLKKFKQSDILKWQELKQIKLIHTTTAEYGRKILYMAALSAIRFNKYCRELY